MTGRLDQVTLVYMVPGHTKFEPDALFSNIAQKFRKTDVFNTEELLSVIESIGAKTEHLPRSEVRNWKKQLPKKFKNMDDITTFNLFNITKNANGGVSNKVKQSLTDEGFEKVFPSGRKNDK